MLEFIFDHNSTQFSTVEEYNLMFLKTKFQYFNDLQKAQGHLFLNEVFDELGMPRSKEGQLLGWTTEPVAITIKVSANLPKGELILSMAPTFIYTELPDQLYSDTTPYMMGVDLCHESGAYCATPMKCYTCSHFGNGNLDETCATSDCCSAAGYPLWEKAPSIKTDKDRIDEMFQEIREMEITPFGYILDFLIDQGLTLEQATNWFNQKGE